MGRHPEKVPESEFKKRHPVLLLLYIAGIMVLTMLTKHPALLTLSLVSSIIYGTYLMGKKSLINLFFIAVPMFFFTVLILPLFSHDGASPLFYINGMPVTKENVIYGLFMLAMLLAVFQWCRIASVLFDSGKLLYLTGKFLPSVSLLLAMVFGLIPRVKEQFEQIENAQKGMGRRRENLSFPQKIRHLLHEFSILISWSLENSIERSISMESKGYGTGRRSHFHLYHFTWEDGICFFLYALVYTGIFALIQNGAFTSYFFPELYFKKLSCTAWGGFVLLSIFLLFPLFYDIYYYLLDDNAFVVFEKSNQN